MVRREDAVHSLEENYCEAAENIGYDSKRSFFFINFVSFKRKLRKQKVKKKQNKTCCYQVNQQTTKWHALNLLQ